MSDHDARDTVTGRYTTDEDAANRPAETVVETRHRTIRPLVAELADLLDQAGEVLAKIQAELNH